MTLLNLNRVMPAEGREFSGIRFPLPSKSHPPPAFLVGSSANQIMADFVDGLITTHERYHLHTPPRRVCRRKDFSQPRGPISISLTSGKAEYASRAASWSQGTRACMPCNPGTGATRAGFRGCMARRKSLRHRPPHGHRAISSAGERPPDTGEVSGSIPLSPTSLAPADETVARRRDARPGWPTDYG